MLALKKEKKESRLTIPCGHGTLNDTKIAVTCMKLIAIAGAATAARLTTGRKENNAKLNEGARLTVGGGFVGVAISEISSRQATPAGPVRHVRLR